MRKVLLGILVIIVLVIIFLLASPVYYGKQAQFFIKKAVSSANQNYGRFGTHVSIESYQRGWYSSTTVIDISSNNIKFKDFYKKYIDSNFDLKNSLIYKEVLTVSHGPIMYRSLNSQPFSAAHVQGHIQLPADLEQRLQLTVPIITFDGSISYTGMFTGQVTMPAFRYNSPQFQLTFGGLTFFGSMSSDIAHFSGDYTMQPLKFRVKNINQDTTVQGMLSLVTAHFDFQKTAMGLWVGESQGHIQDEKIIMSVPDQSTPMMAEYKGITTNMNLILTNNDYSMHVQEVLASYQMFNYIVRNIKLNLEINNLNAMVAQKLQDIILRHLFVRDDLPLNQDAADQFMELLPQLMTKKTAIKLKDVSMQLPQGPVAVNGEISWPGYEAGMPLFTMAMIAHVSLHISAGKDLVDQAIARANQYAQEQAAATLPTMEPGPVIPAKIADNAKPAVTQPAAAKPAGDKPVTVASTNQATDDSEDDATSYLKDLAQAGGLFQFCLSQGYIAQDNNAYTTTINYAAGQLTANGKRVKM